MQDAFTTAQFSEAGRKINEDFDLRLAAKRCGDNAVVLAFAVLAIFTAPIWIVGLVIWLAVR